LAAALIVGLIVLGAVWYGISFVSLDRLWSDILGGPGGPMTFRFILQPAMGAIAALRDGSAQDVLSGSGGGDCGLAGVCSLFAFCAVPLSASRAIWSPDRRPNNLSASGVQPMKREGNIEPTVRRNAVRA
jgi:hypothetical protein